MLLNRLLAFAPELGLLVLLAVCGLWNITLPEITDVREVLLIKAAYGGMVSPLIEPELARAPLFVWILQVLERLFGTGLVVERCWALLSSLLAVAGVYTFAMLVFKNRIRAMLAAGVLATCSGFVNASVTHGPSMLFLGLGMFSLCAFHFWLETMTVSRSVKWHAYQYALVLGTLLALVFLAAGLPGFCMVVSILIGWLVLLNRMHVLRKMPWRYFLIPFFLIALPWPLLLGVRYGLADVGGAFLNPFGFQFLDRLGLYADTLFNGIWPYLLFLIAAGLDVLLGNRRQKPAGDLSTQLALLWLVAGIVFGGGVLHPSVILLPALALWLAPYLGGIMEGYGYRFAGMAVDLTVVFLMLQAVAMSVLFYQELTDHYPAEMWHLPGPPVVELFATFAVWKLWLLPLPLLLLAAGLMMYLMSSSRRIQNAPVVLIVMALAVAFYMRAFYWPIMQRVVVVTMGDEIKKQRVHTDRLLVDASNPELLKVIPSTQKYLPRNIALFHTEDDLSRLLTQQLARRPEETVQNAEEKTVWGIAREEHYYSLPVEDRLNTQVMAARREWHGFDVSAVTGFDLFFRRKPETIVLFRVLPYHLRPHETRIDPDN